jgi:hypothetical protein
MVAIAYNPSYLGGRDQEGHVLRQPEQKVSERPHLNKKKQVWCFISVILAMQEAIGRRITTPGWPSVEKSENPT